MIMGEGAIVNFSNKKSLNTPNSIKAELVKIMGVLTVMMWSKCSMETQGYTIDHNILFQDNMSTILLTKNGRMPISKKSKHTKNRYFLVTDKVAQKDPEIHHKSTEDMWADMMANPKKCKVLHVMRSHLVNVYVDYLSSSNEIGR